MGRISTGPLANFLRTTRKFLMWTLVSPSASRCFSSYTVARCLSRSSGAKSGLINQGVPRSLYPFDNILRTSSLLLKTSFIGRGVSVGFIFLPSLIARISVTPQSSLSNRRFYDILNYGDIIIVSSIWIRLQGFGNSKDHKALVSRCLPDRDACFIY